MARSVSYGGPQLLNTFFSARWSAPTSITNFLSKLIENVHKSPTTPAKEAGPEHYWHTQGWPEYQCLVSDGHYASLAIVTRTHCSWSRCCSWFLFSTPPPLLPEFLGSQPAPLAAPPAGAGRRSLGSDTRLKTHQFLGELYRNNICTRVEITLVG